MEEGSRGVRALNLEKQLESLFSLFASLPSFAALLQQAGLSTRSLSGLEESGSGVLLCGAVPLHLLEV